MQICERCGENSWEFLAGKCNECMMSEPKKIERTKCPDEFDAAAAMRCFERAGDTMAKLKEEVLVHGKELFDYDWSVSGTHRASLYVVRNVLKEFLEANPCGVFKKTIIEDALRQWQAARESFLTKGKKQTFLGDQAYNLAHMLQCVYLARKSSTSGVRLPGWLFDLVKLLNVVVGDSKPTSSSQVEEAQLVEATPDEQSIASLKNKFLQAVLKTKGRKRPLLRIPSDCTDGTNVTDKSSAASLNCSPAASPIRRSALQLVSSDSPARVQKTMKHMLKNHDSNKILRKKPSGEFSGTCIATAVATKTVLAKTSLAWYDEVFGVAKVMKNGTELEAVRSWPDKSGYMAFEFEDGWVWVSDEPALSLLKPLQKDEAKDHLDVAGAPKKKKTRKKPDKSTVMKSVMKKPGAAPEKSPTPKSPTPKNQKNVKSPTPKSPKTKSPNKRLHVKSPTPKSKAFGTPKKRN